MSERSFMFGVSFCAAVYGIDGCLIRVEADVSNGLPGFSLVGFLSSEVKEARERVQIGMKNAGFYLPPKKITMNLSPADIKKNGTGYDLAIAVSVFAAFGYFSQEYVNKILFIGELGLEGGVKEVHGVLPMVYTAYEKGIRWCVVPKGNVPEAGIVEGMHVVGVSCLKELVLILQKEVLEEKEETKQDYALEEDGFVLDFKDVCGQEFVKRAVLIAAAGRHNLLMSGPPGSGKTMIAKRFPGILPEMTFEEQMEVSKIYSVAGLLSKEMPFVKKRPFRSPHHTITKQALTGGGHIPKPGEISLASGGVLFLDELAEFKRETIEVLRQPLEEGYVHIARTEGTYRYPAKCQLIAATNPCRCGFYPDRRRCICTEKQIRSYLDKISGPMLERIDLCVEMQPLKYHDFFTGEKKEKKEGESSEQLRNRVLQAYEIQKERYRKENFFYNAQIPSNLLETYCPLTKEAEEYLSEIFSSLELSARVYHKLLKVARTIADLEQSGQIGLLHIAEAVLYRMFDKKFRGGDAYDGIK